LDGPGNYIYESENEFVASVSPSGVITTNRVGTTDINVVCGNYSGKVTVTVTPQYNPVTR